MDGPVSTPPANPSAELRRSGSFGWFRRLSAPEPWAFEDAALLGLRLVAGLSMALHHGLGKVRDLGKFTDKVADLGFPLPEVLGPFAALSEFAGGLLIALGLLTRAGAVFVLATMLTAAVVVHAGDPFGKRELSLLFASVSLLLLFRGGGRYSLDAWMTRRVGDRGAP
jgi:putative oxidoreductase